MRLPPATLLTLAAAALGACSSSSSDGASTTTTCSGAPHVEGDTFAVESEADLTKYPACAPRCGAAKLAGGPFYPIAALPVGACSAAPTCAMAVQYLCGCPTTPGPVNGFRCDCVGGAWRCVVAQQGSAVCLASCPDAGGDGGGG